MSLRSAAWTWAGATSAGSSHLRDGATCQDAAACREFRTQAGPAIVGIVSDGAGSAPHAQLGSRIACRRTLACFARHFAAGGDLAALDEAALRGFLDDLRGAIAAAARRHDSRPRDFAATLVAVAIAEAEALILHVGDGGAVIREAGKQDWRVPSWPAHGEYVSTTFFVTDDPEPRLRITRLGLRIDAFALFTDGLERLVLDFANKAAFGRFFDHMLQPVAAAPAPGRDRALSWHLRRYLDSAEICERTDDDKSLLLASRRGAGRQVS